MSTRKKTEAPAEAVEQTANLPAIPTGEDYINQAVNELQATDGQQRIDEAIAMLQEQYGSLTVTDLNDRPAYIAAVDGAKLLKKLRTSVEAKRKELNDFPLKFQRAVNEEAKRITALIQPLEDRLKAEADKFEKAEEAARKAEQAARHAKLIEAGWVFNGSFYACGPIHMTTDQVMKMNEEQMEKAVKHGEDEKKRQAAEDARRKAEADRLAKEQEDLRKQKEQMRAEAEAMKRERLDFRSFKLGTLGVTLNEKTQQFERYGVEFFSVADCGNMTASEFDAWLKEIGPDPGPPVKAEPQLGLTADDVVNAANAIASALNPDPISAMDDFLDMPADMSSGPGLFDGPSHTLEYIEGFDACRGKVLAILNDKTYGTRSAILNAINSLKP